jgi:hypothetical protein
MDKIVKCVFCQSETWHIGIDKIKCACCGVMYLTPGVNSTSVSLIAETVPDPIIVAMAQVINKHANMDDKPQLPPSVGPQAGGLMDG